uniref:PRONE domain-containing protein n=1 Tax=Kalanchoe fedtschenkoi TaxID=63787 RepID=A0A7N0T0E2_KALFE
MAATVFGNLWRLEPLDEQKKAVWRREIGWLLCVSDSIVEFVPSIQQLPCGGTCEVMITQPRSDLHANLPALKKLHALLLGILDGFRETEFSYIDPGCRSVREEDKWWLPCPTVPENGLSDGQKKRLQDSRYRTEQILKATMAINNSVLAEMEIPSAYFDALSMSERAHLGESIYNCITADQFAPECLVECLNLSSEHQTLKVVNRVEVAVHLWRKKDLKKLTSSKSQKFSLSGKVKSLVTDGDMNHLLAERAESLLRTLRLRFPNLPQTSLDMSKIQHNKDVGQAILESYSRVMESLAFNIMARIDDLIFADDANKPLFSARGVTGFPVQKRTVPSPFTAQHTP